MTTVNDREYRALAMSVRARDEPGEGEMRVHGYATTFNEPYMLYRREDYELFEQVDAHAFDECDMSDVIMQFDHAGRVYARTRNNTLALKIDKRGLYIEADLSRTDSARQLYQEIREGMVDRMSYGFVVKKDEWTEQRDMNSGKVRAMRTIKKVRKLYDVSAVSYPANDRTSIATRALCDEMIAQAEAERAKRARARLKLKIKMMEG